MSVIIDLEKPQIINLVKTHLNQTMNVHIRLSFNPLSYVSATKCQNIPKVFFIIMNMMSKHLI